MADEKQLAILRKGVEVWNEWRTPSMNLDLVGADLKGADLRNANFMHADLSETDLRGCDLSGAWLLETDLREANLSNANLIKADLTEAKLNHADLREANLYEADLLATRALSANFEKAVLTGACIEDWQINRDTNFDGVICDYVYLQYNQQERRPSSGNFAPGEFTKLFRKTLETVDLILTNGLDWVAFLNSFQKLQVECGSDELFIQAFENKGDAFVIRVSVPPGADKAEIEKFLKRQYELETQLEAQKQLTEAHYRHCTDLKEIARLLAGRTINVEARAVAESQFMPEAYQSKYDQRGANIGSNVDTARDNARVQSVLHNYAPQQKQTLAEAAAEIQRLLKQLEETNPTATEAEQKAFINAAIPRTHKERFLNALQQGGKEALQEFLDNSYLNVAIAVIEGWKA